MAVTAARTLEGTGTRGYKAGDKAGGWQVKEQLGKQTSFVLIPKGRQSHSPEPCSDGYAPLPRWPADRSSRGALHFARSGCYFSVFPHRIEPANTAAKPNSSAHGFAS